MNLVPLFEEALEFQNYNGTVLSNGKVAVYYIGRTRLADIYNDVAAEYPAENPRILDNLGMGPVYVSPAFDYEIVVFDEYNNELFSVKKYLHSKGEHSTANVVVTPSENIAVSAWTVGDVQVYMPYLTGQLGKVYQGIDPIVVNNTEDKISANHVPLGVQDPLYFVQDDEEGCIIGCSAQTEIPSAISGKWDAASDVVIANSAQWAENTEYEEGNYISIDNNVINVTGLSPVPTDTASTGLVAQVSAEITGMIPDTSDMATQTWVNEQGYLTAHQSLDGLMSASLLEYSGAIITAYSGHKFAGEISGDAGDAEVNALVHSNSATWDNVTAKLDTTAFSDVSSTFLTAVPEGYATESWVTAQGYLTAETDWSDTITAASANAYNEATAAIPTGLATTGDLANVSADITAQIPTDLFTKASADTLYYGIDNPSGFITGVPADMATTGDIADLAQSISETYQPIGNYQTAGDYLTTADSANFYTTANESGFITGVDLTPYQLTADMTAYQPVGNYLSATDSANFLLTSDSGNFYPMTGNPSGFINELPAEEEVDFEEIDLAAYQPVSSMTAYANSAAVTGTAQYGLTTAGWSEITGGGSVPQGTMVESGLDYDNTKISGYSGSAFKDVALTDVVTANSGAWGGSALPISAGPGIKVDLVDNTLVFSNDETVLWSGDLTGNGTTAQLSESIQNFERIKVYGHTDDGIQCPWFTEFYPTETTMDIGAASNNAGWGKWFNFTITTGGLYTNVTGRVITFGSTTWGNLTNWGTNKVVGINRIAGE